MMIFPNNLQFSKQNSIPDGTYVLYKDFKLKKNFGLFEFVEEYSEKEKTTIEKGIEFVFVYSGVPIQGFCFLKNGIWNRVVFKKDKYIIDLKTKFLPLSIINNVVLKLSASLEKFVIYTFKFNNSDEIILQNNIGVGTDFMVKNKTMLGVLNSLDKSKNKKINLTNYRKQNGKNE